MALLDNKIGPHRFIGLTGVWSFPKEIVSLDERPGVNGTEVTKEAVKGRPFTLRSWVDLDDYDAAIDEYEGYLAEIAGDPVDVTKGGISSIAKGFKCKVLDVRKVYAGKIGASVGGINADHEGYLECDWDMVAIPI